MEARRLLATLPQGFVQTIVSEPLSFASTLEIAPDGKLFVVEQSGFVQVYEGFTAPPTKLQANFFRDTPPPVNFSGERGLFGIAFDPDYATNRFVYIHYTLDQFPFPNRLSRYVANAAGDLALAGSEVVLLTMEPSTASNHNGGAIHFGPDGKLYVAVGDNAAGSNAQSITTLKGKILRLNATPGDLVPSDNPSSIDGITGTTSGIHRAIWAAGLRNPYTFAFQPGTGRMFINDVGEVSWEEINQGAAARNFGWPATEGDFDPGEFPDFTRPVLAYHHLNGPIIGQAIVGAAFYNPTTPTFPPEYLGDYFFGDFSAGWIKRIDPLSGQASDFADATGNITDLRVAPDGSLLYVTYDAGRVFRVQFDAIAPSVIASEFVFDGFTLPDSPHRLRFTFSEDVSASLSVDDLILRNTTTSQLVPASHLALEWDSPANRAEFTFPGFEDGILPDGNYTATLPAAAVTDAAGNPLAADGAAEFFFLIGDANHDRSVSLSDFDILAANFGQTNRTFSQGDFNYDGVVNLADFNRLAGRFGVSVAPRITAFQAGSHRDEQTRRLMELIDHQPPEGDWRG
jgi:glucose/arabinose dehydrogenase